MRQVWSVMLLGAGLACAIGAGCGSSITTGCETVATTQCERCYSCDIEGEAPVSGATLCGLSSGQTQEQCIETITARCENQSGGRQNLDDEFEACQSSQETLTCDSLHLAYAQDKRPSTSACGKLF